MKKFLIKSSIIVVILLAVMFVMDRLITYNLHHSDANMLKGMNDIFFDSTHYDVVVMGSSRGLVQYDTRVLDTILNKNCYNLSVNGRGIISQVIKYRCFEKQHGRPEIIIQNIDCFLLEEDNGFEKEQYISFFFDEDLFEMVKSRENFSDVERYIPLIRYAGYVQMIKEGLGMKNKMIKTEMYKGYEPRYQIWDGKKLSLIDEVGFGYNPVAVTEFKHFLKECNEKGIKVVFVYSPLYSEARRKMSDESNKFMLESFECLAKDFHIPILSWWDCPISEDTAFFYNATHLNASGAAIFTYELAHCLDTIGLFD